MHWCTWVNHTLKQNINHFICQTYCWNKGELKLFHLQEYGPLLLLIIIIMIIIIIFTSFKYDDQNIHFFNITPCYNFYTPCHLFVCLFCFFFISRYDTSGTSRLSSDLNVHIKINFMGDQCKQENLQEMTNAPLRREVPSFFLTPIKIELMTS